MFTKWSPLIRSLKEKEITDLQEYIAELQKRADNEKDDFTATSPYHLKLTEAGKKIGQQNGCVAVVNAASTDELVTWSAPGTVFVNLTAEICAELKLTSK